MVDFGRGERLPAGFTRALRAWLALFGVHPVDRLPEAVEALAARRGRRAGCRGLHRGYAVYATVERPARG